MKGHALKVYMRAYQQRRYRRVMARIIRDLGGKCVTCGTRFFLQTDHIDKKTKKFNISTGIYKKSKREVQEEVKKCQLLCRKCHREKGIREGDVVEAGHGSFSMYARKKCRCTLCVKAKSERDKAWRLKKKYARANP